MNLNIEQWLAIGMSASLSVVIFWLFKLIGKRPLFLPAVIVWNYLVCVIMGGVALLLEANTNPIDVVNRAGFFPIISLGILFMITFLLMGRATASSGAALSAVASKMSVVIPVITAIGYWHEPFSTWGLIGMGLALISVFLISYQPGTMGAKPFNVSLIWVFIGSGLVDTGMGLVKHASYSDWTNLQFTVLTFTGAALTGIIYLTITSAWQKWWEKQEFYWGLILGIINLVSILAIYRGLDRFIDQHAIFFMLNNVAVVAGSFLLGMLLKETYSNRSIAGLLLAILAIFLLG